MGNRRFPVHSIVLLRTLGFPGLKSKLYMSIKLNVDTLPFITDRMIISFYQ